MTPRSIELTVDHSDLRLDQFLAQKLPHISRSQVKKLIQQGHVQIDHHPAKPSTLVQPGDFILVQLPSPEPARPQPEAIPLDILFEDEQLIVVNKPAGLVVHPAPGHPGGTLVNGLLARYPALRELGRAGSQAAQRPGIVHRLDQDTSGVMVVARTPEAARHLRRQFKARTVDKIYLALVFGRPDAPEGLIDVPLARHPRHRKKFAPQPGGKPARTYYRTVETFTRYSLLEIGLETGRTHQIRVHLAWLGHPVVGDTVYGRRKVPLRLDHQFLHAWRLSLDHPHTGERLTFEAPLPAPLSQVLTQLGGRQDIGLIGPNKVK